MSIPTSEEVLKMIVALKKIMPHVRHYSLFGDDNHKAIKAQIIVLEEGLDEDDIYDEWPEDGDMVIRDAALEAWKWADGQELEEGLPEGWQSLVEKENQNE